MAISVEIPKLGNTVEECLIARWCKQKGERVSAGDVVAEIETDKASFEVTAPEDGTLLETFFEEGALVPVFTNLFVIGDPGESVDRFRPRSAGADGPQAPAAPVVAEAPDSVSVREPIAPTADVTPAPATRSGPFSPRAKRFARERRFHPESVTGSGPGGRVLEADLRALHYSSPRVSSAAKKHIRSGAEVSAEGSGPGGMIVSSDLSPPATRISSIREKIARRMRESVSTTAQYTLHSSADAGALLNLRARIKASTVVADININEMVTFCTVKALLDMPDLNAHFVDGRIANSQRIHIGFACDTPRGLLVPVVRDAHRLSVEELALRMKDLAARATEGKISADDLTGATFTVSNLGGLGIESFTPLLNPPQVAILGVDAIQLKAIRRQGRVEFIDSIGLSLTCDHQVIDGAPGARFLQVLREKIENVESLCTI